jgi:serine/threonine protein kinase/Tol biopolymer transport system component
MALAPGTKLGPYEIQGLLGAGGMGEVYRARDSRLKRDVAVKVLPPSFSADADRLRRFEQEALATAALNHPNLLAVFDIGEADGAPYVVSELLDGETLRERLRGGAIPVRKALDYALQIAQGLAAAHGKGVIHRDLKPENLFVTRDGRVKILDFGLAKLTQKDPTTQTSLATMSEGTEAGAVLGTAGYMSPEQVRGKPLDTRSDIFSFGAILYEMLSGKRAFHGETPADTMSAILKEEPEDLSATNRNVSPALERIVQHCLEKNPEARFHSASDIAFDLEHLSGISSSSVKLAVAETTQPARKLSFLPVGVVVLPILALAAGWWFGHNQRPASVPQYKAITFRRGGISQARFTPDGSIVFNALWEGSEEQLYLAHQDDPGSHELGLKQAEILSISRNGELAVRLRTVSIAGLELVGTLGRVALDGGTPREILDNVMDADWSPDGQNLAVARFIPENGHWHIEYPIGKVLVDSIDWVSSPRISPDGKWIAFADHENNLGDDEGSIALVSADGTGKEKKLSTGWEAIEGIVWSGSSEIWFTTATSGFAVNPHAVNLGGKIRDLTAVPGGMELQDIRNGAALVVTKLAGTGIRVSARGASEEREMGWFDQSVLTAISRDDRNVLFFDVGEGGGPNYSIFLRGLDGSPPVALGQGRSRAISPDGKWVVAQSAKGGGLNLTPTRAGEPRSLTHDAVNYSEASYLPDGKQILAAGIEPGHGKRDYLIDVATGNSKPVTPEGTSGVHVSPDGKSAAVRGPDGNYSVWALDGSGSHPIPGLDPNYTVISWAADGNSVFVRRNEFSKSLKIYQANLSSGKMDLWKSLGADAPGVGVGIDAYISPDGLAYAYTYSYRSSQAFVVTGLK